MLLEDIISEFGLINPENVQLKCTFNNTTVLSSGENR